MSCNPRHCARKLFLAPRFNTFANFPEPCMLSVHSELLSGRLWEQFLTEAGRVLPLHQYAVAGVPPCCCLFFVVFSLFFSNSDAPYPRPLSNNLPSNFHLCSHMPVVSNTWKRGCTAQDAAAVVQF